MITLYSILGIFISYLLGSLASSVWMGQFFYGKDLRDYGSGNAGSTNAFRVFGPKVGIPVMAIDIAKGFGAASIGTWLHRHQGVYVGTDDLLIMELIFGLSAVVGHVFPIFAGFRGGKGINTLLGMMFVIHWQASLFCLVMFIIVLQLSRYVSLGSILAALTFPVFLLAMHYIFLRSQERILIVFGFVMFLLVVITHQKNIRRLLKGEESKTFMRLRRRKWRRRRRRFRDFGDD